MPEHTPAPTHSRSIYGFFMYIFFKTALIVYLLWAYLPNYMLNYLSIYYFPQKYWAIAVPIQFLTALFLFAFFVYPGLNLILTPAIDSINTITDSYSIKYDISASTTSPKAGQLQCICKDKTKCYVKNAQQSIRSSNHEKMVPHAYDLDIRMVSRKLYLKQTVDMYKNL